MNLIISQPLQLITIQYLQKQPYEDVAGLIQQLQRLQPAPPAQAGGKILDPAAENNGEKSKDADLKKATGLDKPAGV